MLLFYGFLNVGFAFVLCISIYVPLLHFISYYMRYLDQMSRVNCHRGSVNFYF